MSVGFVMMGLEDAGMVVVAGITFDIEEWREADEVEVEVDIEVVDIDVDVAERE